MDNSGQVQLLGPAITIVVVIAVMALRNRRPRRLRVDLLWIRPVVVWGVMVLGLIAAPPPFTPLSIGLVIGALVLGGALGWQRGRMMRIDVDPTTHGMTVQASPTGVAFILAFVVLRLGLRSAPSAHLLPGGFPTLALPSALLALGVGMMSVQGLEMWLRASGLLAGARAAQPTPGPPTEPPSTT